MAWFKVDDGMHSHPKILDAGNEAIGLWARCGSYCSHYLTEGFVKRDVALLYGDMALVDVLVKVGLFEPVEGGWQMHDFLVYNPTKEKVLADREAAAKRQRDARERAKQAREKAARNAAIKNDHADSHGDSHGVTNAVSHADSHIASYAHEGADGFDRHAVTHVEAETAQDGLLAPVLSLVQSDAGHDVAEEMSRRDSRGESRAPRPDPTRPVLPTEVQEQNLLTSPTASPSADDQPASKPKRKLKSKLPAEPRPDVEALCDRLVELMVENGSDRPDVSDEWRTQARLLLDADHQKYGHREFDKAMRLLEWALKHHFWWNNIRSIPKFRKQYSTLRDQALDEWRRQRGIVSAPSAPEASAPDNVIQLPKQRPSTADQRVAQAKAAGLEFAAQLRAQQSQGVS